MLVTWWILLIVFGLFGFSGTVRMLLEPVTTATAILTFIAIIIAAVAAGMIWG